MQLLERAAAIEGGGAAEQGAKAQKLSDTLPSLPAGEPAATRMRMLHRSRKVRHPCDGQCGRCGNCLWSVGGREPHSRANDAAAASELQGYMASEGKRSFAAPERYRQVTKRLGMAEDHLRGSM